MMFISKPVTVGTVNEHEFVGECIEQSTTGLVLQLPDKTGKVFIPWSAVVSVWVPDKRK